MQITLKQSHIEQALRDYVAKAGITFNVDDINFTAGRGKDGLTAAIELEDPFSVEPVSSRSARDQQVERAQPAAEEAEQPAPASEADEPTAESADEQPEPPFATATPEEEVAPAPKADAKSGLGAGVSLFG